MSLKGLWGTTMKAAKTAARTAPKTAGHKGCRNNVPGAGMFLSLKFSQTLIPLGC